jgi:hypothetical protein
VIRKSICLSLILLVGFLTSLPRAEQTLTVYTSGSGLFLSAAQKSFSNGLLSVLKVRRFGRRILEIAFFRLPLSSIRLLGPSTTMSGFFSEERFLLSREADPLIQPPA